MGVPAQTTRLLIVVMFSVVANAATTIMLFEVDASSNETNVKNCTCRSAYTCSRAPTRCTSCVDVTTADIAATAQASAGVTWWYTDSLVICCESASVSSALTALDNLLDFAHLEDLKLRQCHELAPAATDKVFTLYGLLAINVQADVQSSFYPDKQFDINDGTDLTDMTATYRDFHIAFLTGGLLDDNLPIKAWSHVASIYDDNMTETMTTALARSPETIKSKSDGTYMFTPIYG